MEQMNSFCDSLKSPAAGACQGGEDRERQGETNILKPSTHTISAEEFDLIQFAERNWNCEEFSRWAGAEPKISCPPFCWSENLPCFQGLPHPDWKEVGQPLENLGLEQVTTAFRIQKFV